MDFWTIIFIIYAFFTFTPFFTSLTQAFEVRRLICLKVGENYYHSIPKQGIFARAIAILTSFFLCAIPIMNFFMTFYLIIHDEEMVNNSVQKWLTEHNKGEGA